MGKNGFERHPIRVCEYNGVDGSAGAPQTTIDVTQFYPNLPWAEMGKKLLVAPSPSPHLVIQPRKQPVLANYRQELDKICDLLYESAKKIRRLFNCTLCQLSMIEQPVF